ncbi:MAG TPA: 16S rRNA (cytidine(1402)-2'-O)-methyltransferase [Acidimicrobiales bacterium]|nr:16S rRNA (cytidine(1402)-2'-O)-methyltransferase [Acidimicrobiales bacterium]
MTGSPPGTLVLVATPIGNLGDLSPRAVQTLADADVVLCEDTRRTRQLLSHAGISARRLVAVHAHREAATVGDLRTWLAEGRRVALVSDAGTPAVSDPGARLVSAAVRAGARVEVVPGPSAALAALVASGLPTDRFAFEGFLPRKGPHRADRLRDIATEQRTVVLFESPVRLASTLADLAEACGAWRPAAVAREITKVYEEVWRGSLGEGAALAAAFAPRGEQVVVVGGCPPPVVGEEEIEAAVRARLEAGDSPRDAASAVAGSLAVGRRRAYEVALRLR